MMDTFTIRTDQALIESILERGFDPVATVTREDFLRFMATAEAIDEAGPKALATPIATMGDGFGDTGDALTLPVAVGWQWLCDLLATTPVSFSDKAKADAAGTLIRRLVPVLQQTVQFEAMTSRSFQNITNADASADHQDRALLQPWLDRWRLFPVLAALVTLVLVHWIRAFEEMVRALEQDHRELAEIAQGSTTPLALQAINGDAGDTHLGGRSVMLLTFTDGTRVVFKPKQLAVTDVFRALVDRINATGFEPALRVHKALVKEGHTWEQFVPHRTCSSEDEIERFYGRMGAWIRLLQVLEGRDFWLDNLIADGEFPVFIDLETILQPRRAGSGGSLAALQVQERLDASPIVTNIVALLTPIGPEAGCEDLGCFAAPKDYLSPFPATAIPGVSTASTDQGGYRTWSHPEHAPMLDDQHAAAEAWYPAIEAGYRSMAEAIVSIAPELLAPGGILDQLSSLPVRTIFRDTWTCIKIINRSTAPPLLGSYQRRNTFLASMKRPSTTNDGVPMDVPEDVITAEIRSIAELDVPFFTTIGVENVMFPADAAPIPGIFVGTVRERIKQRLEDHRSTSIEDDVAYLRTSFWTALRGTPPMDAPIADSKRLAPDEPVAAALAIGQGIMDDAILGADGSVDWPTLVYHPLIDLEHISPLGGDFLSGRPGLALLASQLWAATGEDLWRERSLTLAGHVAKDAGNIRDWWERSISATGGATASPPVVGAFSGVGGVLATTRLAAGTLNDTSLYNVWQDFLAGADWQNVLPQAPANVVEGSIGLGLSLTACPAWTAELPERLRDAIEEIAMTELSTSAIRPSTALERLAALPSDRIARVLLRSRLSAISEDDIHHEVAILLDGSPTVGDLLGIIELSRPCSPWWGGLSSMVAVTVQKLSHSPSRLSQINAAELALAMWRTSDDHSWHFQASTLGRQWIVEFNEMGTWFPNELADDRFRLSAVWGVPAIALVLLRLGDAPVIASPRTLHWQPWKTG